MHRRRSIRKNSFRFKPMRLLLCHWKHAFSVSTFAIAAGLISQESNEDHFSAVVEGAGDRMKMAGDIIDFEYFFKDDITYDEKGFSKANQQTGKRSRIVAKTG